MEKDQGAHARYMKALQKAMDASAVGAAPSPNTPLTFREWLRFFHPEASRRMLLGERLNNMGRVGRTKITQLLREARAIAAIYGGFIPKLNEMKIRLGDQMFDQVMAEPLIDLPPIEGNSNFVRSENRE